MLILLRNTLARKEGKILNSLRHHKQKVFNNIQFSTFSDLDFTTFLNKFFGLAMQDFAGHFSKNLCFSFKSNGLYL